MTSESLIDNDFVTQLHQLIPISSILTVEIVEQNLNSVQFETEYCQSYVEHENRDMKTSKNRKETALLYRLWSLNNCSSIETLRYRFNSFNEKP